jgi:hypothetical protein
MNAMRTKGKLDYSKQSSWAVRPDVVKENNVLWGYPWEACDQQASATAAAFYVHPTTYIIEEVYFEEDPDVVDDEFDAAKFNVIKEQASTLTGAAKVYAPFYRQMTMMAQLNDTLAPDSDDFEQGSDKLLFRNMAYRDIKAAFAEFLKQIGSDTDFFVMGHSQGSNLIKRLLYDAVREKIAGFSLNRLVAAYFIGEWVDPTLFSVFLPPCKTSQSRACIVSYASAYDWAESPAIWLAGGKTSQSEQIGNHMYCLEDKCASESMDTGSVYGKCSKPLCSGAVLNAAAKATAEAAGADASTWYYVPLKGPDAEKIVATKDLKVKCDKDNILRVTASDEVKDTLEDLNGDMHNSDFATMWQALRADVILRAGFKLAVSKKNGSVCAISEPPPDAKSAAMLPSPSWLWPIVMVISMASVLY